MDAKDAQVAIAVCSEEWYGGVQFGKKPESV